MSDVQPSYRLRNIVLAVIAGIVIGAAAIKLMLGTPQASRTAAEPAASSPAAERNAISVVVSYAGIASSLPDTAKVYVFIRPVGERMPLGVQTFAAHDLPATAQFSNPSPTAAAQSIEAVARLSMTGAVSLQPGDLESVSDPLQFIERPQNLQLTLTPADGRQTAAAPATTATAPTDAFVIPVRLALAPGITLPPATTVFLIVRAAGAGPMPLAVKRMTVGDLPIGLSLSDADAMVPGKSLREAGTVELIARTSISGNVKAGTGDYEGSSGILNTSEISTPITLTIDRAL